MAKLAAAAGAAALLGFATVSKSAEPPVFEYLARAGLTFSDNVGRTAINETSSAAVVLGGQINAFRPEGRLTYEAIGDLSYHHYFESRFSGELLGYLSAESAYEIIPESLSWNANLSFGQGRQNQQLAASPGNRESILTLSTGPTVRARFGQALEASFDARISRTDYSKRGFDSTTVGGQLVLGRRPSANAFIGLGASADQVSYSGGRLGTPPDFDRNEGFVRLEKKWARMQLSADGGVAKIKGGGLDDSSPLFRVRLVRRLTPFVSATAGYEQYFPTSDSGVATNLLGLETDVLDSVSLSSVPRLAKNASLGLSFVKPRTSVDLSVNRLDESARLGAIGERVVDIGYARFVRAISPRSNVAAFANFSREKFPLLPRTVDEKAFGAELSLNFGVSLGMDFRLEHRDRNSSSAGDDYNELAAGVFVRYGRVKRRNIAELDR